MQPYNVTVETQLYTNDNTNTYKYCFGATPFRIQYKQHITCNNKHAHNTYITILIQQMWVVYVQLFVYHFIVESILCSNLFNCHLFSYFLS